MTNTIRKPLPAWPGARIAVVSPASSARPDRIARGLEVLWSLGYDAVASEHAFGKHPPYFSGTPQERLDDLHAAWPLCPTHGFGIYPDPIDGQATWFCRYASHAVSAIAMMALRIWLYMSVSVFGVCGTSIVLV